MKKGRYEAATLRNEGKPIPKELRRAAAHAGRSAKGGHVALNRFKARVRHVFDCESRKAIGTTRHSGATGGEPDFRELEPHQRMARSTRRLASGCVGGRKGPITLCGSDVLSMPHNAMPLSRERP